MASSQPPRRPRQTRQRMSAHAQSICSDLSDIEKNRIICAVMNSPMRDIDFDGAARDYGTDNAQSFRRMYYMSISMLRQRHDALARQGRPNAVPNPPGLTSTDLYKRTRQAHQAAINAAATTNNPSPDEEEEEDDDDDDDEDDDEDDEIGDISYSQQATPSSHLAAGVQGLSLPRASQQSTPTSIKNPRKRKPATARRGVAYQADDDDDGEWVDEEETPKKKPKQKRVTKKKKKADRGFYNVKREPTTEEAPPGQLYHYGNVPYNHPAAAAHFPRFPAPIAHPRRRANQRGSASSAVGQLAAPIQGHVGPDTTPQYYGWYYPGFGGMGAPPPPAFGQGYGYSMDNAMAGRPVIGFGDHQPQYSGGFSGLPAYMANPMQASMVGHGYGYGYPPAMDHAAYAGQSVYAPVFGPPIAREEEEEEGGAGGFGGGEGEEEYAGDGVDTVDPAELMMEGGEGAVDEE